MTKEDDFLKIAEAFRWYVLPLPVKGKKPDPDMCKRQRGTMKWKDHPNAFANHPATPEEVREWAREGLGIGVILGEGSGVLVFEMDYSVFIRPLLRGLEDELCIPTVKSPSGGHHLYSLWTPGVSGKSLYLPGWNDKDDPVYCGRSHLGSIRGEGQIAVLPPSEGYEWLEGRSIFDCELTPVPDVVTDLIEFCEFVAQKPESITAIGEGTPPGPPTPTPVLETVLVNDVNPELIRFITAPNSTFIPALVRYLGGEGLSVRCPYHPPDHNPSATLWLGDGGWRFVCHHADSINIFISQLSADLLCGYCDRIAAGDPDPHRHYVTRLERGKQKARRESWVHITRIAAGVGVIELPPSRLSALEGFTADGERAMRFIDGWGRAYRYTFNKDEFPLARRWLISIVFALSSADEKSLAWKTAFREIDNALDHALKQKMLEKVAVGKVGLGGTAAIYRLLGGGD